MTKEQQQLLNRRISEHRDGSKCVCGHLSIEHADNGYCHICDCEHRRAILTDWCGSNDASCTLLDEMLDIEDEATDALLHRLFDSMVAGRYRVKFDRRIHIALAFARWKNIDLTGIVS